MKDDSKQVCSFELTKKLKELGVKQEGFFWYIKHEGKDFRPHVSIGMPHFTYEDKVNGLVYETPIWEISTWEFYPAFTVAELLELMPLVNGCPLQLLKGAKLGEGITYCARYDNLQMHYGTLETLTDENPANALAKMLVYLIEEGHISNAI